MRNGGTKTAPVTSLVRPASRAELTGLPSRELQELWFATLRRPWQTLALVPTQRADSVLSLAKALATIGQMHRGSALQIISTEGMGLSELSDLLSSLQAPPRPGVPGRLIVIEPITTNPLGTAIALACDAALLCVEYGDTRLDDASRTLEQIGRNHFVGCTVMDRR